MNWWKRIARLAWIPAVCWLLWQSAGCVRTRTVTIPVGTSCIGPRTTPPLPVLPCADEQDPAGCWPAAVEQLAADYLILAEAELGKIHLCAEKALEGSK